MNSTNLNSQILGIDARGVPMEFQPAWRELKADIAATQALLRGMEGMSEAFARRMRFVVADFESQYNADGRLKSEDHAA